MGCFAQVGRQGGVQRLNLQPDKPNHGCLLKGTIFHELLHSLGFFHMHASHDRDKYVQILWDNIKEAGYKNFQMLDKNMVDDFGFEYDLLSILHYNAYAYAKVQGLTTIEPFVSRKYEMNEFFFLCVFLQDKSYKPKMGQRKGMTRSDLGKLFKMYKCNINVNSIPADRNGIVIL